MRASCYLSNGWKCGPTWAGGGFLVEGIPCNWHHGIFKKDSAQFAYFWVKEEENQKQKQVLTCRQKVTLSKFIKDGKQFYSIFTTFPPRLYYGAIFAVLFLLLSLRDEQKCIRPRDFSKTHSFPFMQHCSYQSEDWIAHCVPTPGLTSK